MTKKIELFNLAKKKTFNEIEKIMISSCIALEIDITNDFLDEDNTNKKLQKKLKKLEKLWSDEYKIIYQEKHNTEHFLPYDTNSCLDGSVLELYLNKYSTNKKRKERNL